MDRTDQEEQSSTCESCISSIEEETTSRLQLKQLKRLSDSEEILVELKHRLYSNLGEISIPNCRVLSGYKNLHTSGSSKSRLQTFQLSAESIRRERGNANVKNAWFSCSSKMQTLQILNHGFESSGAHLFPLNNPIDRYDHYSIFMIKP